MFFFSWVGGNSLNILGELMFLNDNKSDIGLRIPIKNKLTYYKMI